MDTANLLVVAMAEECRDLIRRWKRVEHGLPKSLQTKHLAWMCDSVQKHAEVWPAIKLHRWIGFIQAAMMANKMLDLDGVRTMFDKAKVAHGDTSLDLLDHLDPTSSFELDIGGEG